jgi:RNA polymerase sigma-B factor
MASPLSPSRRKQQAQSLSRSALKARNALVLEHLPLADAIASVTARRLFPLVEREDLIQGAREALVRSAPRCRAGEPAEPYLRRCIAGAASGAAS